MFRSITYERGNYDIIEICESTSFKTIYENAIHTIKSGISSNVDIYSSKDYSCPKYELHLNQGSIFLVRRDDNPVSIIALRKEHEYHDYI